MSSRDKLTKLLLGMPSQNPKCQRRFFMLNKKKEDNSPVTMENIKTSNWS
jgi:hypothetical protein